MDQLDFETYKARYSDMLAAKDAGARAAGMNRTLEDYALGIGLELPRYADQIMMHGSTYKREGQTFHHARCWSSRADDLRIL
jgi:hypothetical protein